MNTTTERNETFAVLSAAQSPSNPLKFMPNRTIENLARILMSIILPDLVINSLVALGISSSHDVRFTLPNWLST